MSTGKALAVCARQGSIKRSISMNMNIASRLINSVQHNSIFFLLVLEPVLFVSKVRWPSGLNSLCRDRFTRCKMG
jgi:hypothetical protein